MSKTMKGVLAAAVAALLLLGGAGSLAYWNDSATAGGLDNIQAGELKFIESGLASDGVTTLGCGDGWIFDADEDAAGKVYVAGDLLVPGDELTMDCQYEIVASGEHLRASFAATGGDATGTLISHLTVDAQTTVGGNVVTEITEANNAQIVSVSVSVLFNTASGNDSQTLTGSLADIIVTLQQVHS